MTINDVFKGQKFLQNYKVDPGPFSPALLQIPRHIHGITIRIHQKNSFVPIKLLINNNCS